MKNTLLAMAVALVAISLCGADEIRFGDSRETVIAVLGEPEGYILAGQRSLLYYERGRVELMDNQVVSAELVSPKAAEVRRFERLRQEELRRQAVAKRVAEGLALREQKLADPAFLKLPAASRIAYWQAFMQNYPGVPVGMDYEVAQREREAEEAVLRAEAERARQIAELQERAADAEERARQAYSSVTTYSYPVFVQSPYCAYTPKYSPRHDRKTEHRSGNLTRFTYAGPSMNVRLGSSFRACR